MADRLDLQAIFEEILGSRNVYFQPPSSVKMNYPAIRFSFKQLDTLHANNKAYKRLPCYEAILIDKNPDSEFVAKIMQLPYCQLDRSYTADNLNHFAFTLYF